MHAWLKEVVILGVKWIGKDCLLQGKRVFFFFFDYAVMAEGRLDSNAPAGRYEEGPDRTMNQKYFSFYFVCCCIYFCFLFKDVC